MDNKCENCVNWNGIGFAENAGWCEKKDVPVLYDDKCDDDFELLGCIYEESIGLTKAAIQPITINPEIVEAFNSIGCTSFQLTSEEIKNLLERSNNESN